MDSPQTFSPSEVVVQLKPRRAGICCLLKKKPEENMAMEQKWNLTVRSVWFSLIITQDMDLPSKITKRKVPEILVSMSKIHLLSTHHISGAVCVVDILCHRPALGQSPPLRRSGHVLSVHTAGHLLAIPSPEQRLGFRVASSTEVNYTWYVARDPVKFSPFPAVESDGSSKGSAPLPAGH